MEGAKSGPMLCGIVWIMCLAGSSEARVSIDLQGSITMSDEAHQPLMDQLAGRDMGSHHTRLPTKKYDNYSITFMTFVRLIIQKVCTYYCICFSCVFKIFYY